MESYSFHIIYSSSSATEFHCLKPVMESYLHSFLSGLGILHCMRKQTNQADCKLSVYWWEVLISQVTKGDPVLYSGGIRKSGYHY